MNHLWLLLSFVVLQSALCLEIIPNQPELVIRTVNGSSFTLTCHDTENITWTTYPQNEKSIRHFDYHHQNQNHSSTLIVTNITYMDTGYYNCSRQRDKHAVAGIYVYVFDGEHYLALEEEFGVFQSSENKSLIIPCKPTLPNISVTLENQEDDSVINFSYDPKVGHVLQSPTVKDSKLFQCVGINPADSTVETMMVRVIINLIDRSVKPRIDLAGGWKVAAEGSPFSLNCSVQLKIGSSVFLNWKYPNEDVKNRSLEQNQLETFGENIKNNYKVLTISNLTKFDTGNYTCEVEDPHSGYTANTSYYVNVFDANGAFLDFKILTDLTNHTQKTGYEKIQWMFNVTSYPAAVVSCKFPNGQSISTIDSTIPNKYHLTLTDRELKFVINVLEINDTGTYVFTADNGRIKQTVNSSIFVEDKPVVHVAMKNESSLVGEISEVECIAIGYPRPQISWMAQKCTNYPSKCESVQEIKLSSSDSIQTAYEGKPHMTKSILRYRGNETTKLFCSASNSEGSNSSSIPFIVTDVEGGFAVSISSAEVTVGDNVNITCKASKNLFEQKIIWHYTENPHSTYKRVENWTDSKTLNLETKLSYVSVINFPSIQISRAGWYKCAVNLHEGGGNAATVDLPVTNAKKPSFKYPTNLNGSTFIMDTIEGKHQFVCVAEGVPKPTLTWYKDRRPLVIRKNDSEHLTLSSDNHTLSIKFPRAEHAGEYKCQATNKEGQADAKVVIVVKGLPDAHVNQFFLIILPALLTITLTTCIAWVLVKMQKMKKQKKKMAEDGLANFEAGAVNSINPELGIDEQADLLPYDARWEFPREKLKLGKQLGAGAFGVVLKAEADGIIDPNTSTTVAVKMVKRNVDALYIRALASELKIMIHLGRHLNVVNLLGACTREINKRELVVIVEYCKFGNLHDFLLKQRGNFINQINENGQLDFSIQENKSSIRFSTSGAVINTSYTGTTTVESVNTEETLIGSDGYLVSKDVEPDWRSNYRGDYRNATVRPIKTSDLLCWSFQIARGMEYLASRKVLHGDLAARNVLLADDNIVKICDFGLAKSMYASDNYKRKKNELLPVRWMAVESIRDRVFSIQSDVWSFGITMWELFSLSITPYPGVEHLEALYTKLESGYRLEKPTYATKEIHDIMLGCWHERPTMRPFFTELSERIGGLLENGVRSHYTNLNEVYLQMNANTCNGVDYLSLLNPPVYTTASEEPRYVNLPSLQSRESPEPEEDVELKPMLNTSDNYVNAKPLLFSNPNYMEINQSKIPTYVNSAN